MQTKECYSVKDGSVMMHRHIDGYTVRIFRGCTHHRPTGRRWPALMIIFNPQAVQENHVMRRLGYRPTENQQKYIANDGRETFVTRKWLHGVLHLTVTFVPRDEQWLWAKAG